MKVFAKVRTLGMLSAFSLNEELKTVILQGLPPYRKAKKIQVRIIRFGCNLGHLIAYLCRL